MKKCTSKILFVTLYSLSYLGGKDVYLRCKSHHGVFTWSNFSYKLYLSTCVKQNIWQTKHIHLPSNIWRTHQPCLMTCSHDQNCVWYRCSCKVLSEFDGRLLMCKDTFDTANCKGTIIHVSISTELICKFLWPVLHVLTAWYILEVGPSF